MKKTLKEYKNAIMNLPLKHEYTKDEILINDLLIEKGGDIEIYYAPHNEYINKKAKIFIVGITPGFQQMSTAIAEARKGLEEGRTLEEVQYLCKRAGRFSGVIRKNIINMLDDLKLNEALNIESSSELFDNKDYLLHTISLIPYSVFVKKKNYTGHTPKLLKSTILMKYVRENFIDELNNLDNKDDLLIIPLGKAVEEVLLTLAGESILRKDQILIGFPHPSGANGNRLKQFEANKEDMTNKIKTI